MVRLTGDDEGLSFATLAMGRRYRLLAAALAHDLRRVHPGARMLVLTDRPGAFTAFPNVIPQAHESDGIRFCYHDKRHVFRRALQCSDRCLFLDADCRILGPIRVSFPAGEDCLLRSTWSWNLEQKLDSESSRAGGGGLSDPSRCDRLYRQVAELVGVEYGMIRHVWEGALLLDSRAGDAESFLRNWDRAFRHLALRGLESGEGAVIGMACLAAGSTAGEMWVDGFFKDNALRASDGPLRPRSEYWATDEERRAAEASAEYRVAVDREFDDDREGPLRFLSYLARYGRLLFTRPS
jgi:hypothetical protein